jgi:trehalose utilization protein
MTEPAGVYPEGINGAIAKYLRTLPNLEVRAASINDPEQGIAKSALDSTDVLIWWAHRTHKEIDDGRALEAVRQIRERGLGFIAIHSAHYAKIFKMILDSACDLGGWRVGGKPESLKCVAPTHPIAQGVGDFTIPHTEMYNEPFKVPPPEATIFLSTWEGGEEFRSCNTWTAGRGRVVYFRPGHETYPIYFQEKPLRVIANAVLWCAHGS